MRLAAALVADSPVTRAEWRRQATRRREQQVRSALRRLARPLRGQSLSLPLLSICSSSAVTMTRFPDFKKRRVGSFHHETTADLLNSGRCPTVIEEPVEADPAAQPHMPKPGVPGGSRGLAKSSQHSLRQGRTESGPIKPGPRSQPPTAGSRPAQAHGSKHDAYNSQSLFSNPEEPVYLLSLGKRTGRSFKP